MAPLLHRLGAFSVRHRRSVLVAWLLAFVLIAGLAGSLKGTFSSEFAIPGTESQNAADLISERIPGVNPDAATGQIVFALPEGQSLQSAETKEAVRETVADAAKVAGLESVSDPFKTGTVSPDGSVAFSSLTFDGGSQEVTESETEALATAADPATEAGMRVEFGGAAAPVESEAPIGELLGVAIALVVLAITFGSLLSAGFPLLTGIFGVGFGILGITLASGFTDLSETSISLAAMIGLAVGIDYTLFIVSRHRTQVHDGMPIEASIAKAVGTAGSAVVFAGATVMIALVALLVTGVPFLAQMGIAAAGTVAMAVLLGLTFVPAILGLAGERAVRGKTFSHHLPDPSSKVKPTMGTRWINLVMEHRIVALSVVIVALVALATPMLHMRLGLPGGESAAPDKTERKAYDLLSSGFGEGFNGTLAVVADLEGVSQPQKFAASTATQLGELDDVTAVSPPQLSPNKDLAIISVTPASGPASEATENLVNSIRDHEFALGGNSGDRVSVTGQTATNIDVSQRMSDSLIPYLAVVVGLALLLLMIAFRSILVPLTAIAGFLLTIVASFGAVTLVFQDGFLAGLIGVAQTGPLVSLLPILIIGVIFGLAMDYQVFLVSRMREEFTHGADAQDAVRDGFRHSARVVTAAGLIMISVFAGFILPEDPIIKSIGFAFAIGILIDAFLIRMTLIPALMSVMGRHAWWFPGWLDRMVPNVDIEGATLEQPEETIEVPVVAPAPAGG